MTRTTGRFVDVSADLVFTNLVEQPVPMRVYQGQLIRDLTICPGNYGNPEKQVIDACIVEGFTAKPIDVKRGATRSYDGVPMRMADPNGGQYRGFVQEVVEVRDMIVKPVAEEGAEEEPASIRVNVENIMFMRVDED